MLDFQVSQYPWRFGLAEGTDPHQVPPGTLTTAENVVWKRSGRLEKRLGTSLLTTNTLTGSASGAPSTGTITAATRLFARGTELCLVDGSWLYGYSTGAAAWRRVSQVGDAGVTWTTLVDTIAGVMATDTALSSSGLLVHAWVTGDPWGSTSLLGTLNVQVKDQATGTQLVLPTMLSSTNTNFGVRVLVIGTTAIILTRNGAASPYNLTAYTINLTTFAVSSSTNLRTDCATAGGFAGFDACVIGSNFVVAYNRTGPVVALESYSASLVSQASGSISGEASGCSMISIDGASGEVLYVFYTQAVATPRPVRIAIANSSTLAQTVAPVTIETPAAGGSPTHVAVCRYDSSHAFVMYRMVEGTNGARTSTYRVTSAASVETSARGTWWGMPLSRPFVMGGKCYVVLADLASAPFTSATTTVQTNTNSALVEIETGSPVYVDWVPHRYVCKVEALLAGIWPRACPLPSVSAYTSTSYVMASPFLATAPPKFENWRQGVRLITATTGANIPTDMWRSFTYGKESYVLASGLSAYDGRAVFDYGFPRSPWIAALTTSGAAGNIAAGTYLYGGVQEFRSNAGVLHRSPTWTSASILTAGATSTNHIDWAGTSFSTKQSALVGMGTGSLGAGITTQVATYRSTVGGSNYQRLSYEPAYNTITIAQDLVTTGFNDRNPDSDITNGAGTATPLAARPALYTTGGILDDEQPPAGVTMFHHVDRLWVLAGDQKTWWYSKTFSDDLGTAPGFSPSLLITFDEVQTAGASMDDKAVFFSATGVKYMLGTGPGPNGLNSDFQTPTTIQSDVGCTNARSVVGTPDGVMFLSDRGIYLLDRGMSLSWIGRQVKDTLALFPTITSATLVAKQNQVRFTCNAADGLSGCTLVYDYVERQWTTFRHAQGVAGANGIAIADACMWNGAWTFVTAAGQVYTEDSTSYLDGGGWVPITLETAWITGPQSGNSPSSGPLKLQSVRNFQSHGRSNTDHDLSVDVGFDSNTTYQQNAAFAAQGPVTTVGIEEWTLAIGNRRKCGSIRFRIRDASPSSGTLGTGQGPSFDMMGLEVGIKHGLTLTPATKRA